MDPLLRWLFNIKDTPILEKQTLMDLTKYEEYAFWWILHNRIYYDLLQFQKTRKRRYRSFSKQVLLGRSSLLFLFYVLIHVVLSKFLLRLCKRSKRSSKKSILVTTDFTSWTNMIQPETKVLRKGHIVFQPIFDRIRQRGQDIDVFSIAPFGFTFRRNIKRAISMKASHQMGNFVPLECCFSIHLVIKLFRAKRHFSKTLNALLKTTTTQDAFRFQDIDLFLNCRNYLAYYFNTYLPLSVFYYELALNAIESQHISLVVLIDEYLQLGRALQFAAQKKRIPVMAVQHGIIHKYHPGYVYTKDVISPKYGAQFPFVPIPKKTAVYGPHTKVILTEVSSYPKSSVIVTGQPRYDWLKKAHDIYRRDTFCQRYNLDTAKPIALIATQPFPLEELRVEFFENTVRTLKSINDIQIVVKPHPNEKSRWHQDRLSKLQISAIVLPPRGDTVEAIFAADIFFSVNSTTILEALMLEKPVIVVNFSKLPEVLPWTTEKAVIEVTDTSQLAKAVQLLLSKENKSHYLQKTRNAFLYNHLFKIDGKATERVLNIIDQFLR